MANSYAEKSPALAAAALLRMEGLDFSKLFTSPAEESLANDNIIVFTLYYVLQYIIGTWYLVPVPSRYGRIPNFEAHPHMHTQPRPAPTMMVQPAVRSFCLRTDRDLIFVLNLNDLT